MIRSLWVSLVFCFFFFSVLTAGTGRFFDTLGAPVFLAVAEGFFVTFFAAVFAEAEEGFFTAFFAAGVGFFFFVFFAAGPAVLIFFGDGEALPFAVAFTAAGRFFFMFLVLFLVLIGTPPSNLDRIAKGRIPSQGR